MKRLASILFIFILLCNLWGYRFMIECLQQQQQDSFSSGLDKIQYNEEDLISIKTVLNLPYYSSSVSYERAYGSIHINGVDYEYVKQRVFNDTLELLCIPNKEKSDLQSVKDQVIKFSIADQNSQSNKKNYNFSKIGFPDFVQDLRTEQYKLIEMSATAYVLRNNASLLPGHDIVQDRPPQCMQFFM